MEKAKFKWGLAGAGLWMALAAGLERAAPAGPAAEEYALKAAVLFNLAKFVEWPAGTFREAQDPIQICVLGADPFGNSLEQAVAGKAIDSRPVVARRVSELGQAKSCQVLFVSSSERARFGAICGEVKSAGILTVGDANGFLAQGGVINLAVEANRIRIQINMSAAEQERIRISSRLLGLAQIVNR